MMNRMLAHCIRRWRKTVCYAIAGGIVVLVTAPAHAYIDCPGASPLDAPKEALDGVIKECTAAMASARRETLGDDRQYGLRFLSDLYANRGEAYYRKRQYVQALSDFDQCIVTYENFRKPVSGWTSPVGRNKCSFDKARTLVGLKRYDEAIAAYQKAIELTRGEDNRYLLRGCLWDEIPDELTDCHSTLEQAYGERAKLRLEKGNRQGAAADYKAILEIRAQYFVNSNPAGGVSYIIPSYAVIGLASAYEQAGELAKAEQVYTDYLAQESAYLKRESSHPEVYFLRGRIRFGRGDLEHSLEDLDAAVRYDSTEAEYRLCRAKVELAMGQADAAMRDLNAAIANNPAANNYVVRADVYRTQGNFDAALADLNEAIRRDGKSASNYLARGAVHASKKDFPNALSDLDTAIRLAPKNPEYFTVRGILLAARGSFDKALADYGQAIQLDSENAQRYTVRAWAFYKAGRAQAGLDDANRALKLAPKSAEALATRAHIQEALGRKSQAIGDYRKALEISPGMPDAKEALVRLGAS